MHICPTILFASRKRARLIALAAAAISTPLVTAAVESFAGPQSGAPWRADLQSEQLAPRSYVPVISEGQAYTIYQGPWEYDASDNVLGFKVYAYRHNPNGQGTYETVLDLTASGYERTLMISPSDQATHAFRPIMLTRISPLSCAQSPNPNRRLLVAILTHYANVDGPMGWPDWSRPF